MYTEMERKRERGEREERERVKDCLAASNCINFSLVFTGIQWLGWIFSVNEGIILVLFTFAFKSCPLLIHLYIAG